MRLLACSACLTGTLLFAGPLLAGKYGDVDPFEPPAQRPKSLAPPDRGDGRARAGLDRSDLIRLMRTPTHGDAWMRRPRAGLDDAQEGRDIHPLFRRANRRGSALSGLDWRQRGSFEGLKNRYEAIGNSVKSKVFGKGLADNVSVELDGSPEIEFEFQFD